LSQSINVVYYVTVAH